MTAQALLLEAVPSLKKNHDLLMEMLMRPDDFTLALSGAVFVRSWRRTGWTSRWIPSA